MPQKFTMLISFSLFIFLIFGCQKQVDIEAEKKELIERNSY